MDKVQEVGNPYQLDEPESADRQRTYLSEIKQFWEDSTASISSPYFAEQAAVALAKIPVGDIETNPFSHTLVRASTFTVEGYKRTVEALFPAESTEDEATVETQEKEQQHEDVKLPEPGLSIPYVAAMARMAGRRPFKSNNGYVGLGPTDLEVGDTIVIPYGSPVPFAFRQVKENEDSACRLVGEVFVFGIMDGEFMKVHRQETVLRIV